MGRVGVRVCSVGRVGVGVCVGGSKSLQWVRWEWDTAVSVRLEGHSVGRVGVGGYSRSSGSRSL